MVYFGLIVGWVYWLVGLLDGGGTIDLNGWIGLFSILWFTRLRRY